MELKAHNRTILGRKSKSLRREGLIPAELYGHGVTNRHLAVNEKNFEKIYKTAGEHSIVTIITEEDERIPVIIAEAAKNPMSQKYLNVDLHQIRMDEKIRTKIPIEFTGEAPATKQDLILVKVLNELEVEALPQNLPQSITVNIENLTAIHQSISVSDIKLSSTVKALIPEDSVIVTITERKAEKPETPAPVASAETSTATPETSSEKQEKSE